jgi:formylglycine-generating enzyme required for sulfatase activity
MAERVRIGQLAIGYWNEPSPLGFCPIDSLRCLSDRRDSSTSWKHVMRAWGSLPLLCITTSTLVRAQVPDSEFVLIKPGTFQMGDASIRNASPHTVTLTRSFGMQKTLVTQGEWIAVMGSNPSYFKACGPTCPVEDVNYDDAQAFIAELNRRSPRKHYRLPSEAEWEYAARAGTTGDYITTGPVTLGGWIDVNSDSTTHPVGRLRPNAWGLYDMAGNVFEWVNDWFGPYDASRSTDPTGPPSGDFRIMRGGSWAGPAAHARAGFRFISPQAHRAFSFGFRLAKTP